MNIDFTGEVAIVTGAGGGMGRAYALELARRGARVLVNDYGGSVGGEQDGILDPALGVVDEILTLGGEAVANGDPVGTAASARAILSAALDAFGRIDILVNNAGTALPGPFTAHEDEAIERHYATNLIGGHHLMRAVWPHMAGQHHGRILNISSNGALGVGGNAPYAAAKAGMLGLTLDAAIEGRPLGILVNAVMPTAYSRMIEQIPDAATVDWFRTHLQPEQVAAAMIWFLSRDCTHSGRILATGGGRLAQLLFTEAGEIFDPAISAETVARRIDALLDEGSCSIVHDQAEAGARYFRFFPWTAGASPDFGPDVERA